MTDNDAGELLCIVVALRHFIENMAKPSQRKMMDELARLGARPMTGGTLVRLQEILEAFDGSPPLQD